MTNTEIIERFTTLVRARTTGIWVRSREEVRVERVLARQAELASPETPTQTWVWDAAHGIRPFHVPMTPQNRRAFAFDPLTKDANTLEITAALDYIAQFHSTPSLEGRVYILRDAHRFFGPDGDPVTIRTLRSLVQQLQRPATTSTGAPGGIATVIVLGPTGEPDATLLDDIVRLDWPLPDRQVVGSILDAAIAGVGRGQGGAERVTALTMKLAEHGRDTVIDSAVGLTSVGVMRALATSVAARAEFDPQLIVTAKKDQVNGAVLRWVDPDPRGIEAVGGLGALKAELAAAARCASPAATAAGLPLPKGVLLFGVPGCGKSFIAKAAGSVFNLPVLRLDPSAAKSKFVGTSEEAFRVALQTVEAVAPVVLWVDEVEKAFSGAMAASDGGTSSYILGHFLHWMQEHAGMAYLVATANGVTGLPPEFLRKGRFDDVFFVDLPTPAERLEILQVTVAGLRYPTVQLDLQAVVQATAAFSGAEAAEVVSRGLRTAFCDGQRPLQTSDMLDAAAQVVPLSKTSDATVRELREWAKTRARPAALAAQAPVAETPVSANSLGSDSLFAVPAARGRN